MKTLLALIFFYTFGNSYGADLLNKQDLNEGLLFQEISSFDHLRDQITRFWMCSDDPNFLQRRCIEWGKDDYGVSLSMLEIILNDGGKEHNFAPRHAIPTKDCTCIIKSANSILDKKNKFCVMGESGSSLKDDFESKNMTWVFIKVKSSKGSVTEHDFCE